MPHPLALATDAVKLPTATQAGPCRRRRDIGAHRHLLSRHFRVGGLGVGTPVGRQAEETTIRVNQPRKLRGRGHGCHVLAHVCLHLPGRTISQKATIPYEATIPYDYTVPPNIRHSPATRRHPQPDGSGVRQIATKILRQIIPKVTANERVRRATPAPAPRDAPSPPRGWFGRARAPRRGGASRWRRSDRPRRTARSRCSAARPR